MKHETDLLHTVHFFEMFSIDMLDQLDSVYAANAFFKDPFNEVRGLAAIERVYRHMFDQVEGPRFVITKHVLQDEHAFLTWDFQFRMKRFSRAEHRIRGASHLHFDKDGRIICHRDYWDAAEELYEKIPVLGGLMRILKRSAAA
jgi:steroid delta-isomerase